MELIVICIIALVVIPIVGLIALFRSPSKKHITPQEYTPITPTVPRSVPPAPPAKKYASRPYESRASQPSSDDGSSNLLMGMVIASTMYDSTPSHSHSSCDVSSSYDSGGSYDSGSSSCDSGGCGGGCD